MLRGSQYRPSTPKRLRRPFDMALCSKCKVGEQRNSGNTWCNACRQEWARANYAKKAGVTRATPCIKCGGAGPFKRGLHHTCAACESAARRLAYSANSNGLADKAKAYSKGQSPRARKDNSLRYHYGISILEFDAMLEAQHGLCAICDKSGLVRGLLCSPCNKGLGHFKDDSIVMRRALAYLTKLRVAPAKKEG